MAVMLVFTNTEVMDPTLTLTVFVLDQRLSMSQSWFLMVNNGINVLTSILFLMVVSDNNLRSVHDD